MQARICGGPGWATTQVYPARAEQSMTTLLVRFTQWSRTDPKREYTSRGSNSNGEKTTNLARRPSPTVFCLLETRLRGSDSRTRIRGRLSRTKSSRNRVVFPEGLEDSRLRSFARAARTEDRCFFLRCYRNPKTHVHENDYPIALRQWNLLASAGRLCPAHTVLKTPDRLCQLVAHSLTN